MENLYSLTINAVIEIAIAALGNISFEKMELVRQVIKGKIARHVFDAWRYKFGINQYYWYYSFEFST